jgi:hypothetical protein
MSKMLKSIVGLVIVSASIGLTASPVKAESKLAQCKRLQDSIKTFARQLKMPHEQSHTAYLNQWLRNSETGLKQLQAKQFSDPKIRGMQQASLDLLVQLHNDTITTVEAVERRDRAAYNQAYQQMDANFKTSTNRVEKQFATYCVRSK